VATLKVRDSFVPRTPTFSMDTIRQRFLQAEDDFLSAARSGDKLTEFADRWETLQSDWESCFHEADSATRQLVDGVAAKVERLAGDFFTFETRTVSLKDDLLSSLEDVFASLTLEENSDPSKWLLRNLHNPYPLPHVRFSTSRTAGSKSIKDWFAKARRRIGWTRLLRDRFSGCRSLAIDAAFRAFVRDNPADPLDTDLKTAFLAIKSHAELVYGKEDTPPPSSSKRSRSVSPTPSLTFSSGSEDSDDEQYLIPSPEYVLKRPPKRAFPDSPEPSPPKRRRSVDCYMTCVHRLPTLRTQEPLSTPELRTRAIVPTDHAELPPLRSKKRRLSENDSDFPRPKYPRGMEGGRLHAVSDPLAEPTSPPWFDFDQSFQIPNPASTNPLDSSPFDLEFFDPPSLCAAPPVPGEFYRFCKGVLC